MSDSTARVLIGLLLIGHGLGHTLTALPLFGLRLSDTHSPDSAAVARVVKAGPARGIGVILNLLALLAFLAAGLAVAGWGLGGASWETLAVEAVILSSVALALYWDAYPFLFPNKVGVIVVNTLTLLSIIWLRWPPQIFQI